MSKSENIQEGGQPNPVYRHFLNNKSRAQRHGFADAMMGRECLTEQFREPYLQREYLKGYLQAGDKYSDIVAQSKLDACQGEIQCRF